METVISEIVGEIERHIPISLLSWFSIIEIILFIFAPKVGMAWKPTSNTEIHIRIRFDITI